MADVLNPMPGMEVEITVHGESLPGGGNPGDVLTKTEGGSVWEHVDVASSWDDLKDKPFYSTEIPHVTSQMPGVPIVLYKVSSEVPDVGNLTVGDPVRLWEFYSGEISDAQVFKIENGICIVGELFCVYVTEDNSSIDINGAILSFPERGVYFCVVEDVFKIIGASLANPDEPEISWDGNAGEIKTIDAKYLPEIPAEKLPEIPAEKLPEIPAEKLPGPFYTEVQKTFEGSFDKATDGRDTFIWNAFRHYKISEFAPKREDIISFSGTRANGVVFSSITEGENCCKYGFFIVVYQAGQCKLESDSFNAPSGGLYAGYTSGNDVVTAGTYNFTYKLMRNIIQSSITLKKYYLDVDDSGALITTEIV